MPLDLRRAVSATLMPGFAGPTLPAWVAGELADGLGAVCLFGTNVVDAGQVRRLTDAVHTARASALVAIDEEGGDVTRLHHAEGSPHPSMAWLGHLNDPGTTTAVGRMIGAELRAAGVDLDLAPVADVNSNPRNPVIGVRSFAADPQVAARHVAALTRGLQSAGVAACAKHFPGHGDTSLDSHKALPAVAADPATLSARELVPFRAAVAAGILAVMTSHILVPAIEADLPATLSARVLGLLRTGLGFDGAVVSDALDMAGASAGRGIPEAAVLALAAGVDLLCLGTDNTAAQVEEIRSHILRAVAEGRLPEARVRDAAARVAALAGATAALRSAPPPHGPQVADGSGVRAGIPTSGGIPGPDRLALPAAAGFWLRGPIAPVAAPVFLRLESEANVAAGATVWGVGPHLAADLGRQLPGATFASAASLDQLDAVVAAAAGRPLVVQGRDLARVPFLSAAATRARRLRPDAVLVDLGWPVLPGDPPLDVATYGSGRHAALGLVQLLAGGTR